MDAVKNKSLRLQGETHCAVALYTKFFKAGKIWLFFVKKREKSFLVSENPKKYTVFDENHLSE